MVGNSRKAGYTSTKYKMGRQFIVGCLGGRLLDEYACTCDWDVNQNLVMPLGLLPFTLPWSVALHKWKDAATELELALW